jgi:Ca2+/Na+ antiporter
MALDQSQGWSEARLKSQGGGPKVSILMTIAVVVGGIGALVACVGGLMVLVAAFRTDVAWGIGMLFVPVVAFVFVAMHWKTARRGALLWLPGLLMVFFAVGVAVADRVGTAQAEAERREEAARVLRVQYEKERAELEGAREEREKRRAVQTTVPSNPASQVKPCDCDPGDPLCSCF